jgi:acyl-CoA synthetase (NDP forming)
MSARPAIGEHATTPLHHSSLDRLLAPRSIAMVGASNNVSRIGGLVFANLKRTFPGALFPVHPTESSVMGVPAFTSIATVPAAVDLAVIAVPAAGVADVVEAAAARGVGGAVVITSGFAEIGGHGVELQERLSGIARRTGIQLIGPNCIGFMNLHCGVMANFSMAPDAPLPRAGGAALVSQSGGFGSFILAMALKAGLQLGHFVSTGNEVDCCVARVLRYLVEQPEVRVLLACAEALREPEVFIEAARRALALDKPMILFKAGRSEAAARAALRHTGSVAGPAEVVDALCRQYGVHIAHTMQDMLDLGLIFQGGRRTRGKRLGIITTSGGAGVAVADEAGLLGLTVPELPAAEQDRLRAEMAEPFYGSVANPVDTTAQIMARPAAVDSIYQMVMASPCVDMLAPVCWAEATRQLEALLACYTSTDKPMALVCTEPVPFMVEAGVPLYPDPARAVRALAALTKQSLDRPRTLAESGVDGPP